MTAPPSKVKKKKEKKLIAIDLPIYVKSMFQKNEFAGKLRTVVETIEAGRLLGKFDAAVCWSNI